jgi:transposase InsO family protein
MGNTFDIAWCFIKEGDAMPWQEITSVSQREEFVRLASQSNEMFSVLCRRFGISRKTGYKWLHRYQEFGLEGLEDRSRCPLSMPGKKVDSAMEQQIIKVRVTRSWGGRKIKTYLEREGWADVPAASTISAIIKRHNLPRLANRVHQKLHRFEADLANDLWQMDFKGPIRVRDGFVEPLTVLDDHSRFSLGIRTCKNKRGETVIHHLTDIFRTYGLPWRILADNGNPWGNYVFGKRRFTYFEAWLTSLDIKLIHSRPFHPQTCGKEERFHRTLKQELVGKEMNCRTIECQSIFDRWRDSYNMHRPHEALDMDVPADHYEISDRTYPEKIPKPEYDSTDEIRMVRDKGRVRYRNIDYRVGEALKGYPVAIRSTDNDQIKEIYFYRRMILKLDLS